MDHMHYGFRDALLYLLCTILVSLISRRFRINSVIVYLVVGLIIGPYMLNLVQNIDGTQALGELGVVFLLFMIGLELPWERLQQMGRYVFGLGATQVVITGIAFGGLAAIFGASIETAVLIGSGLALSSTAVVMGILSERKEISFKYGRMVFSVLLFQDLAVVVLLMWLSLITTPHSSVFTVLGYALLKAAIVVIGFFIVGRFFLRPIFRSVGALKSSGIFMAMSLLVVLATSMATLSAGLSMELGAFLAGLMLAETEYRPQVEADIKPFRSLLLGLFFINVGMTLNPALFQESWRDIMSIFFILISVKACILFAIARFSRISFQSAIKLALILCGGGEFVFVLFAQASQVGIITDYLVQLIYGAVILSMAATPILAAAGRFLNRRFGKGIGIALKAAQEEASDMRNHVIIVGFGGVGSTVYRFLNEQMISSVSVDLNMARVAHARKKSFPVFFGDARRPEVLHALSAEHAKSIILAVGNFLSSKRILANVQRYFPHLRVFVRVVDTDEAEYIKRLGGYPVFPEVYGPSIQLAAYVLNLYGVAREKINSIVETFLQNYSLTSLLNEEESASDTEASA